MRARVIVLAGPSGAGKSRLAERLRLPVLRLDDFYKNGGDPTLPRIAAGANAGLVDWVQLADGKALSEFDLKALGCQGVSELEGGVWHLLIGDKAPSLSGALEALVSRSEVSAKV